LQRAGGSHGHAGRRAADAALEMIALFDSIEHHAPPQRGSTELAEARRR
jgi:hypothetical protein